MLGCRGVYQEGCLRRTLGCAQGRMLEKAVGMYIGRGFWGEHCNVHQEGCLGRTLGCASGGMFGKDGGDVHQDRGFGMCAQWSCQLLAEGAAAGLCPTEICPAPAWCVEKGGIFYLHHRV